MDEGASDSDSDSAEDPAICGSGRDTRDIAIELGFIDAASRCERPDRRFDRF